MPCNYNPYTGEVETLYERYQRECSTEEIILQQAIEEKTDKLKEDIKEVTHEIKTRRPQESNLQD